MTSVKVAVRVRPFNKQEKDERATNCITMEGPMIHITNQVPEGSICRKRRKRATSHLIIVSGPVMATLQIKMVISCLHLTLTTQIRRWCLGSW